MERRQRAVETVGMMDLSFYQGKRVFVTGHTGFKGAWLSMLLHVLGAQVAGYALPPSSSLHQHINSHRVNASGLFDLLGLQNVVSSVYGDIGDLETLQDAMIRYQPEIVFHLAAQPIVREGYAHPVYTYQTNVMGTVNLLEAVRHCDSVRSLVNVTTDKVYDNREWAWGYRETDTLNGYDPYSNSKSCSELVTQSYRRAFFQDRLTAISACRSGNVIGGGDFAADRIIPDCVRAAAAGREIVVRNPHSVRPYQHVLETLCAYLLVAQKQYENKLAYEDVYNIGPDESDCLSTGELVGLFCACWNGAQWIARPEEDAPHEASFLRLDCARIKSVLGWRPTWTIRRAMRETVTFYQLCLEHGDLAALAREQIASFLGGDVGDVGGLRARGTLGGSAPPKPPRQGQSPCTRLWGEIRNEQS